MKSLDLLLIHPGADRDIYGPLTDEFTAIEPPLWSRLIAGYIRDRGFTVRIIDAEADQIGPIEVAARVVELRPRLLCIVAYGHQPSASTQQMPAAGRIAQAVKQVCSIPVVIVGGHVSALPEQTLRDERVNFVIVGEGPVTLEQLLRGKPPWDIPGLGWRDSPTKVSVNPRPPSIEINELHGRVWDLLPMDKYRGHNWQCFDDLSRRQPYASIYTSLNCPYQCSFCCISAPFGDNKYRRRTPIDVVAEIRYLYRRHKVKTFKIVDEMFVLNERHYMAVADGLIQAGIGDDINIWAYARIDTVKRHTLERMRRAGFKWLALGIESGSKYVRDGSNKALRSDDIVGIVRDIQAAGINVIGNYIFGLPDDDLASMQETLNLALNLNTEFANFYSAMAYPGSTLYKQALAKGWELPQAWSGYSQHSYDCRPLDTQHVAAHSVLAFRDEAFQIYFTSDRYLEMIDRRFGSNTVAHIRRMTEHRLARKLLNQTMAAEWGE